MQGPLPHHQLTINMLRRSSVESMVLGRRGREEAGAGNFPEGGVRCPGWSGLF